METKLEMQGEETQEDSIVEAEDSIEVPMTKMRILKNLLGVCFGFMLLFTSYNSLQNLQSTLNKEAGLGIGGLAIVYATFIASCLFLPTFVVSRFGCKWAMALAMVSYLLYNCANFYAVWGTIAPTAAMVGISAACLWASQGTYITHLSKLYARVTKRPEHVILSKFFGCFVFVFQICHIIGNIISSQVLMEREGNITVPSAEELKKCGASFDPRIPDTNNVNLKRPAIDKVYVMCGIYLAIGTLGVMTIIIFVDNLSPSQTHRKTKMSAKIAIATFNHIWTSRYQKLLFPLTSYIGFDLAFFGADFTKSYITCALGIWNVGNVLLCSGIANAITAVLAGKMVQYFGHIPVFTTGFIIHCGLCITLLFWMPTPEQKYVFFIVSILWGMGDGIFLSQLKALYGVYFQKNLEAAFATSSIFGSVGFLAVFLYGDHLTTNIKIYINLAVLVVGMSGYCMVEISERKRKKAEEEMKLKELET